LRFVKASRSRRAGVDHALSMVLFVVALLEFLLVPACGTSVFLIITALALIDVIAGFTVSLSTARRDIAINSRRRRTLAAGAGTGRLLSTAGRRTGATTAEGRHWSERG
jgi:hypothetical protein